VHLSSNANLSELFLERIRQTPALPAYRQFTGERWSDWTWADAAREVGCWQAALQREGLRPGDRVALCLRNCVEWVWFDQAALGLGLVTVPLYFDDRPENMAWCLNDAGVRLLLLEDGAQWSTLRDRAKTIERVVCLRRVVQEDPQITHVADWLPAPGSEPIRSRAFPNDLATIVYTSGTTGRPKGVMLTHRNILSNVVAAMRALTASSSDRFLSFLPLSHMFERTCGYYSSVWAGAQTVYARSIAQLAEDMQTQRPTILVAVPRIFERIWWRMQEQMVPGSLKRRLFDMAVASGWRRFRGEATVVDRLRWPILKILVVKKLQRRLGGRIRLMAVGGAAFAPDLARIFVGLGLPISQGYGLTEAAPILTANRLDDNDPLTVGRALEGVELRCASNGELLARGPNIMLGYWNLGQVTRAVIDSDGWLHTGDLAQLRNGRVTITGRMKEIIVMSSGEKVAPDDAEQAIRRDPVFEQVMVVGEGRGKLGLLCVAKIADLHELCTRANAQLRDFPGYVRICHVARVADAWTVENGLLTSKLSMRRKEVERRYDNEIASMYATTDFSRKRCASELVTH